MSKLSEYLDEMNVNGQLNYADYSNLRDMADELEFENKELVVKLKELKRLLTISERTAENLAYKRAKIMLNSDSKEAMQKILKAECQQSIREIEEEKENKRLIAENERLKKETVKAILEPLYNTFNKIKDYWFFGEIMSLLASKAREYGVKLEEKND